MDCGPRGLDLDPYLRDLKITPHLWLDCSFNGARAGVHRRGVGVSWEGHTIVPQVSRKMGVVFVTVWRSEE